MQKITIPLGGEDRRIKFTINAIQELEAQIDGKNVMLLMQDRVWSVTDIVSACHCALRTFDNTITRRKVQEWVAAMSAWQSPLPRCALAVATA